MTPFYSNQWEFTSLIAYVVRKGIRLRSLLCNVNKSNVRTRLDKYEQSCKHASQ